MESTALAGQGFIALSADNSTVRQSIVMFTAQLPNEGHLISTLTNELDQGLGEVENSKGRLELT